MNQQQTIQSQRHALTQSLDHLHAEHDAAAAKLIDQPDDFDLLDAVHNARQKIESTMARIALFDEATATHATKSAHAMRIATAAAARDEAVNLVARRVAVAKKIDAALADFQKAIGEYAGLNEQAAHAAKIVVKNASEQASIDDIQRAFHAARPSIGDPIVTALICSDLGKVAPNAVKLAGRAGTATVADVAKLAGDRLAAFLDAALRGG